jgi:integrase
LSKTLRPVDLAHAAGLSTQIVRNYERWGCLPSAERGPQGYRLYRPHHLHAIQTARILIGGFGWECTEIIGKRNKYREVPLNATARKILGEYLPTLPPDAVYLLPSGKTKEALSERALGYIVKKYARVAKLPDVSPHDLRHRFGYRRAESVPLHRLAQIMGHDSLDTTKLYIQGTKHDLQRAVETIAWT